MMRNLALVSILFITSASCTNYKKYNFTLIHTWPDGKETLEKHNIYAVNDSAAYSQAAVIYFLAMHAYNRMPESSKDHISKPTKYLLLDEKKNNIDSVLGPKKTSEIRNSKKQSIN